MEHGAPPASSKHATLPLFKTLLYSYSIQYYTRTVSYRTRDLRCTLPVLYERVIYIWRV